MNETYQTFGQTLRMPFFLIALLFWTVDVFPFIFSFALICAVGQVILFPFFYFLAFIFKAFVGEGVPSFKNYWIDYTARYLRWLNLGYKRIYVWFISGK